MRKEQDHNFDLYIKSMLEDAREEVPPRIWEAVESSLPQYTGVAAWKKKVYYSLALCAAISAIILTLSLPLNNSEAPINNPISQEITPASSTPPEISTTPHTSTGATAETIIPKTVQVTEAIPQAEQEEQSVDNPSPEINIRPKARNKIADQKEKRDDSGQDWNEYLSSPTEKNPKQDRKVKSIEIRGGFGANDNVSNNQGINSSRFASPSLTGKYRTGITENGESLYSIPISVGVGARFYVAKKLSAGIGLNFSSLSRSFTGTFTEAENGLLIKQIENTDITHYMTYLGLPVNLYYDFLQNDLIYFYSFIGGTAEIGLSNKYKINSDSGNFYYSESVNGIQWSAAIGLGIQFKVSNHIGIYLDPSARYYFDCNQPKNIRTQKPLMFSVETGVRFNF